MKERKEEREKPGKSRWRTIARAGAKFVVRFGIGLALAIAAYAIVGLLVSLVPTDGQPRSEGTVTVYLTDNGVHTDIVVPTRTARIDWRKLVPPGDTKAGEQRDYLAFGWGSQDFYLNVPNWSDLTPGIAFRAISGVGGTALHTHYANEPTVGADCRRLTLSAAQYDGLVKYILASGKRNDAGGFVRIPHEGYGPNDAFYEGTGHYSPFFTCNTWANSALKACGERCCLWTAFSFPIFWKHPLENR